MPKRWIETAALALLLVVAVLARAQSGPGKKASPPGKTPAKSVLEQALAEVKKPATTRSALEEALSEALKNNPDLRVASARMQEAEAVLFRTRLLVVQKVVAQQRAVEGGQAAVKLAAADLARVAALRKTSAATERDLRQTEAKLAEAKAALANAQGELAYLLGRGPRAGEKVKSGELLQTYYRRLSLTRRARSHEEKAARAAPVKGAMADKIRKALDRRVSYTFGGASPGEVIKAFQKDNPGIHFQVHPGTAGERVTATLKDVPFRAALELLEDSLVGCRFVVRAYGLLIVPRDKVPSGAVLLEDLDKGPAPADKPAKKAGK
jgi:hypothetical protein